MQEKLSLSEIIKAKIPAVLVETQDTDRAVKIITEVLSAHKIRTYIWGAGVGAKGLKSSYSIPSAINSLNANSALIIRNFRFAISNEIAYIIELISALRERRNEKVYVFFVGTKMPNMPRELTQLCMHVRIGLPTEEEIIQMVMSRKKVGEEAMAKILSAMKGLTTPEIETALDLALASKNLKKLLNFKHQIVEKTSIIEMIPSEGVSSLGGMKNLKRYYSRVKTAYDPKVRPTIKLLKGCISVGVQGCGKTLSAGAVADILGLPIYRWDLGKVYSPYIGESEGRVYEALSVIEAISPCVVLVDEIEKMLSGYKSSNETSSGVVSRVLGIILQYMQSNTSTFFFYTTNDVTALPPELIRSGRIDDIWFVDLPSEEDRCEIIAIHLSKNSVNPDQFDLQYLSKMMEGYTGADIENVIKKAVMYSLDQDGIPRLELANIKEAIGDVIPFGVNKEKIEEMRRWAMTRARPV